MFVPGKLFQPILTNTLAYYGRKSFITLALGRSLCRPPCPLRAVQHQPPQGLDLRGRQCQPEEIWPQQTEGQPQVAGALHPRSQPLRGLRSGTNVIKLFYLFMSVIYECSQKARAFVRIGWKSLPGINRPAYYEY